VGEALSVAPRDKDEIAWAFVAFHSVTLLGQLDDSPGALELVRQMLDPATVITPNEIWFHWYAGPLRANREFRELMAMHGVDVTRDPRAEYAAQQATAGGAE
jgi:hypothetical protein